jgi:hypothetical protein
MVAPVEPGQGRTTNPRGLKYVRSEIVHKPEEGKPNNAVRGRTWSSILMNYSHLSVANPTEMPILVWQGNLGIGIGIPGPIPPPYIL